MRGTGGSRQRWLVLPRASDDGREGVLSLQPGGLGETRAASTALVATVSSDEMHLDNGGGGVFQAKVRSRLEASMHVCFFLACRVVVKVWVGKRR